MERIVGLIIALALAGCGKASNQHHVVAADTDLAAPGEYREKVETRIEMPGAPPRVEERVKTHCLKGGEEPVRSEIN